MASNKKFSHIGLEMTIRWDLNGAIIFALVYFLSKYHNFHKTRENQESFVPTACDVS